jgi:hypothetical protein
MPAMKKSSGAPMLLLAVCFPEINLLARPKDSALPGRYIRRHRPQPQSDIERIDAERGPKGQLANLMLFSMACRAQWNGVAIGRLHPDAAIGCCTHMRGV